MMSCIPFFVVNPWSPKLKFLKVESYSSSESTIYGFQTPALRVRLKLGCLGLGQNILLNGFSNKLDPLRPSLLSQYNA